ncbi:MAG: efflux RND transporter periplasmic adaptor subunit [Thermanaerothrix sp.]|nr:efflux RND transporter periplasmic adaptor subunit [Thermanaerothrix sp.]
MKGRNFVIVGIFVILVIALLLWPRQKNGPAAGAFPQASGGVSAAQQKRGLPAGELATSASQGVSIKSVSVKRQSLQDYILVNGEVASETSVAVYPDTGGKIASLLVEVGTKVSKGTVIAEVDPSKPGASYALNPVISPISGTVVELPLNVGATVTSNTSIATIAVLDRLEIVTQVPERYAALMKVGLSGLVSFEAFPDKKFPAVVNKVSPVLNTTSRTREVHLKLTGAGDPGIVIGMYARIRINTLVYPNRITVPETAINSTDGVEYVYVVNQDNTVSRRGIVKGVTIDGTVEILSGLEEGERVVTEGAQNLTDGTVIRDISTGGK